MKNECQKLTYFKSDFGRNSKLVFYRNQYCAITLRIMRWCSWRGLGYFHHECHQPYQQSDFMEWLYTVDVKNGGRYMMNSRWFIGIRLVYRHYKTCLWGFSDIAEKCFETLLEHEWYGWESSELEYKNKCDFTCVPNLVFPREL